MNVVDIGVIVCLLVTGCAGSSSSNHAPGPAQCNKTDRSGTYLMTMTVESGNCPAVPSQLVSLNADDGTMGAGCKVHSDVWSAGDCKNERTLTCVTRVQDPTQLGGWGSVTTDAVAVTRQETADGSTIDGTISMAISGTDGSSCRGTYGISYVRQ